MIYLNIKYHVSKQKVEFYFTNIDLNNNDNIFTLPQEELAIKIIAEEMQLEFQNMVRQPFDIKMKKYIEYLAIKSIYRARSETMIEVGLKVHEEEMYNASIFNSKTII